MKRTIALLLVPLWLSFAGEALANPRIEKLKEAIVGFQDAFKLKDLKQSELMLKRANRIIDRAEAQADGEFFLDPECDSLRKQVETLTTDFRFEKACMGYFSVRETLKLPLSSEDRQAVKRTLQESISEILLLRNDGFDLYADRPIAGANRCKAVDILDGCRAKLAELNATAGDDLEFPE